MNKSNYRPDQFKVIEAKQMNKKKNIQLHKVELWVEVDQGQYDNPQDWNWEVLLDLPVGSVKHLKSQIVNNVELPF